MTRYEASEIINDFLKEYQEDEFGKCSASLPSNQNGISQLEPYHSSVSLSGDPLIQKVSLDTHLEPDSKGLYNIIYLGLNKISTYVH